MILVGVLVLLSVLVARANASPADDDEAPDIATWSDNDTRDDDGRDDDTRGDNGRGVTGARTRVRGGPARRGGRGTLWVPITNDMVSRVVTVAPPVDAVIAAAYRAAGIADDPAPGWRTRSRVSALIPYVSTRVGQNQAWREVDDPTISRGVGVDLRAAWRLERLLFDPAEPRIAMLDVARRRERRRVAAQVIHVYFDWVAARAAAEQDVRATLDAAEQTAQLDALTAGWFSQALAKRAESR